MELFQVEPKVKFTKVLEAIFETRKDIENRKEDLKKMIPEADTHQQQEQYIRYIEKLDDQLSGIYFVTTKLVEKVKEENNATDNSDL